MTCKIKRRSLRCGGRPKADFGSLFTSVIAPALKATGSIVDESINNNKTTTNGVINKNTIIPSDPTKTPTMRLGGRKKCWIGAAIGAATSIAGSLFGAAAQKREMRRQKSIQDWQNTTQEAANMTTALNNSQDYQEDYLRQFRTAARLGKTLGAKGIYITDGGDATKIGNNTYLLRGGSHEDVNETGQTGIGINVGGNEIEAEGGEVAQKKNGALRIFSAQPILGNGMSPAQAILRGYNKDKVFSQQQAFKKRNCLKDDGSKAKWGSEHLVYNDKTGYTPDTNRRFPNNGQVEDETTILNSRLNPIQYLIKKASSAIMNVGRGSTISQGLRGVNVAQDTYLTPRRLQQKAFYDAGYVRDYNAEKNKDYGLVKNAAKKYIRNKKELPIYSRIDPSTTIQRKDLVLLGNDYNAFMHVPRPLVHARYFPTAIYSDTNGNLYAKSWDLNDYGGRKGKGGSSKYYGNIQLSVANLIDSIGSPTVVTTGYQPIIDDNGKQRHISEYTDRTNAITTDEYDSIANAVGNFIRKNDRNYPLQWNEVGFGSPDVIITGKRKHRLGGRCKLRNGGLTSKDRGSSKHPYPSVSFKDFAGGGRSYPIPTKADAVDALRLAGLHGRNDVRSKVYSKYPSLRKKSLLGSCSRPVKGMRPKADTGIFVPYNKRHTSIYDAPDYNSDYNGGNVLGNGEVTVTAKRIKPTFMKPNNDAMNINNHPANETPYIPQRHNRSRTIFSGGDYLGLGIDTLAALSTGLVNYNTAGKYVLPDRAPIIQASKLPTTYNVNPEIEEVKRYRDRLTGQTFNNTSSSVAALNRSGAINLDALSNLSKLWATKENEENKMLTEDAKNQQTVAAQNIQNELARQSEIARIKNEATQAKGDALNVGLSGLSQAWTNFWTAGRTAYEDDQTRRAMIASSKDATPTRLMEMDFDLSPDVIAALYRGATEDRTKRFYLSRLSSKQRQKYGIN